MKNFLFLSFCLFFLFLSGCSMLSDISSYQEPKKVIVKMVNAVDKKEWSVAVDQFDTKVFVDYSSMTGQPGKSIKSKNLVSSWEKLLKKAKTHHMLTNFEISSQGNSAEVFSHVYASHNAPHIEYWDIYGRYHHKLKKTPKGWKITFIKLIVHGQKGNLDFLKQVTK